jgi:alpha-L-fucosidase
MVDLPSARHRQTDNGSLQIMNNFLSRRAFLKTGALVSGASVVSSLLPPRVSAAGAQRRIADGPFQPTWESLVRGYRAPDWFRDAKFGIWAHWSAQCVPEQGDWYARKMYIQGDRTYDYHLKAYGHPSTFGFMEIENLWKAERWEPERLMALYKRAGARYFVALANHHDNFDAYPSRHHAWNSVNVGPRRDIVGTWARVAREHGLRFGVSNHSAHAWHWYQVAYGYDGEGPLAGVRYDAYRLTKADGVGKWWEGLDPQDLYTGRNMVIPDGIRGAREVLDWHNTHDRVWTEEPPPTNPGFVDKWFLRCQDLIDQYAPDLLYFDDTELPLGQAGLDAAAHFYNASIARAGGRLDVVLTAKKMTDARRAALVEDVERGVATETRPAPWQTDTCIGGWHYDRRLFEQHRYKTVAQVVRMLIDIVSKNGNLLLSVPVRGDGTIDADEVAILEGLAAWMDVHGEGIYGTRPWLVYGEGPSVTGPAEKGEFGGARDVRSTPYTAEDIRFTAKGAAVYAFVLAVPSTRKVLVKSIVPRVVGGERQVTRVSLLGHPDRPEWAQTEQGLAVTLPERLPSDIAVALKIEGVSTTRR